MEAVSLTVVVSIPVPVFDIIRDAVHVGVLRLSRRRARRFQCNIMQSDVHLLACAFLLLVGASGVVEKSDFSRRTTPCAMERGGVGQIETATAQRARLVRRRLVEGDVVSASRSVQFVYRNRPAAPSYGEWCGCGKMAG